MAAEKPGVTPKKAGRFPKSLRLRKKKDFRFRPFARFKTKHFLIVYTSEGNGRIGISIAKKVLRRSLWRNRVRRLIRESFRLNQELFKTLDIHVIAQPALLENWETLKRQDIEKELGTLLAHITHGKAWKKPSTS